MAIMKTTLTLALLLSLPALAGPKEELSKPLTTIVNSVRYGRDNAALKLFAAEEQGKLLVADSWAKGTDAQRKEFVALFHDLFARMAFPKIRKNFEHLDTVLYEDPKVDGGRAEIGSTILINHPMKKQELKVRYQLIKDGAAWKVIDVSVLGDSMLTGIREDQIIPIMKEGGWDNLLKLMKDKQKELKENPVR